MAALDLYNDNLATPRQRGEGAHRYIMSTATLGAYAGLPGDRIFSDLRQALTKQVPDHEITTAIQKAKCDLNGGTRTPTPRLAPIVHDGKSALRRIIDQGKISDEADLWETSPLRLWDEPKDDPALLLETLYEPTDLVWIGERHGAGIMGDTIRPAGEWITHFRNGGATAPFIIINPLNGIPAPAKGGDKATLRGDGNISVYRYCMAEFDNLSREDQFRFWSAVKLPIVALIDSGSKSIHAWLAVQKLATITTSEEWQTNIRQHLYDRILTPLGVDSACSNAARLSRLPGCFRKKAYQRLLWLSTEGRTISC